MQTMTYTLECLLVKVAVEFLWTVTNKDVQLKNTCQTSTVMMLKSITLMSLTVDNSDSESNQAKENNTNEIEKEDLIALKENCKLRDLPYDTCLQNELPEEANQVFSIAPGEGNKPIPLPMDTLFEELANPDKFPYGKGGFADTERDTKLTLRKYVDARLLDQDGRFAKDIEYIFAMQYAVEHKQVRDSISVALRQTRGCQQVGRNLDAGMLKNPQHLQNLSKRTGHTHS